MERVAGVKRDGRVRKVTLPHVGGMPVHLHFMPINAPPSPTPPEAGGDQSGAGSRPEQILEALLPRERPLAVAFLLHWRLGSSDDVDGLAAELVSQCYVPQRTRDLLVVTFDLRNHGHRVVHPLANETWREGNETHAQDMFSIQMGTAHDVSLLISMLPAYLPSATASGGGRVELWACVGVSLGGHAAWLTLVHEPRISVGVPIIGCCDYLALMRQRLRSFMTKGEQGREPQAEDEERYLPAAFQAELRRLETAAMDQAAVEVLKRKKLLVLCGGDDRLVPFDCSKPFLDRLRHAIEHDAVSASSSDLHQHGDCTVIVEQGQGHALSESMLAATVEWILRWACQADAPSAGDRSAKL